MTAVAYAPNQAPQEHQVNAGYHAQRQRLTAAVSAAAAREFASLQTDPVAAVARIVPIVQAGQQNTAALVDAYMAVKAQQALGSGNVLGLDTLRYTTAAIRGVPAAEVYKRPFTVLQSRQNANVAPGEALGSGQAALDKLVHTDLQLAQTHAARDWMRDYVHADGTRVVGWRRVLTGPTSCALCTAASTRTYRTADLMPIHEHCDCIVEPLWGTEAVASVGTTVRVEEDPEIGPRLMADSWSSVGPRIY